MAQVSLYLESLFDSIAELAWPWTPALLQMLERRAETHSYRVINLEVDMIDQYSAAGLGVQRILIRRSINVSGNWRLLPDCRSV